MNEEDTCLQIAIVSHHTVPQRRWSPDCCYWLFNVYVLTNFLWVFSLLSNFPRQFSQILTGCSHYLFSLIHTGCLSFLIRATHSPRHLKCEAKGLKHTESKPSNKKILLKTVRLINFSKTYIFPVFGDYLIN